MSRPISVIVTNYNGRRTLESYLPRVVASVADRPGSEVVVVDDASTDDSVPWLRETMPEVRLVVHDVNQGFPGAASSGFEAASHPYVLLLSSDMVPEGDCIQRMEDLLDTGEDILSISGPQIYPDGRFLCGRFRGFLRRGSLRVRAHPEEPERLDGRIIHQFQNAVGLYRRENYLALGGFCELFAPFYFEEVDLSYRAWKLGYRILYEPEARIVHYVEDSAISAAHGRKTRQSHHRIHQFYMFWKNIDSPWWILQHVFWILIRLPIAWLWGDWAFYQALAGGLRNRTALLEKRRWILERAKLTDDEVLETGTRIQPAGEAA